MFDKQEYLKKVEERKNQLLSKELNAELEVMDYQNTQLKKITDQMAESIGKPVWDDILFHTGKIFGILRTIVQNPKKRNELLLITGLQQSHIDLYLKYCGNLPYTSKGIIYEGRQMNIEKTKELLPIVGAVLGILVTEEDMSDITQERWNNLYNSYLERAKKTAELDNAQTEEEYEE